LLTFFIQALSGRLDITFVLLLFHLLHFTFLALAGFHLGHGFHFDDHELRTRCDTKFFESFCVMIRWNEAILNVLLLVLNFDDACLPTTAHEQIPSFSSRP
jgi:hypothetical protein